MRNLTIKKLTADMIIYILVSVLTSYLFYDSFYMCILFLLITPVYIRRLLQKYSYEIRQKLKDEFCEMIGSLSASIAGGMSVENALIVSRNDMERLYSEDSIIVDELNKLIDELNMNIPINKALKKFADRVKIDDITNFVTVFNEALKTGGNLSEVIKDTVIILQDKRRTEDEIAALLKGKMLEQKVICIIPFLILVYLKFTSSEFISVLYHNLAGNIVMSICLILYITSIIMSEKIISIKV